MYQSFEEAFNDLPEKMKDAWPEYVEDFTDYPDKGKTIANLLIFIATGWIHKLDYIENTAILKKIAENAPEEAFIGYYEKEYMGSLGKHANCLAGRNVLHQVLGYSAFSKIRAFIVEKTPPKGFEIFDKTSFGFPLTHAIKKKVDIEILRLIIKKTPVKVVEYEINRDCVDIYYNEEDTHTIMSAMKERRDMERKPVFMAIKSAARRLFLSSPAKSKPATAKSKPATAESLKSALNTIAEKSTLGTAAPAMQPIAQNA